MIPGRIHQLVIHHDGEQYGWGIDEDYTNYSLLCKDILQDVLGEEYAQRTVKLTIRGLVHGSNRVYLVTNDATFWELLQRNVDIEYPIQLIVDIEEVSTSGTSSVKPKRRLQIEEIVDNSLALVPYESDEVDPISFSIPKDNE